MAFNPDVIGSIKPLTAHKFRKLKNSPTQKRIVWPRFIFSHLDQNLSVTATGTLSNNSRIVTTITDNIATDSIASRTHHHCSNCHRLNIITIALLSFINIVLNEKVRIILVNIESYKSFVSSSAAQPSTSEVKVWWCNLERETCATFVGEDEKHQLSHIVQHISTIKIIQLCILLFIVIFGLGLITFHWALIKKVWSLNATHVCHTH